MTIIFFTVQSDKKYKADGAATFGRKWTVLGLIVGILGLFEFLSDLLRLRSWLTFMKISFVIYIINMLILFPIWLIVLGRQLPAIKASFEDWNAGVTGPLVETAEPLVNPSREVN